MMAPQLPPLGHPARPSRVLEPEDAPEPLRRWRVYCDWTGWIGIGILYLPENRDLQFALGPWVVGVEHGVIDPETND